MARNQNATRLVCEECTDQNETVCKHNGLVDVWSIDDTEFPVSDWQAEVANNDTRLGYFEWLQHRREEQNYKLYVCACGWQFYAENFSDGLRMRESNLRGTCIF